MNYAETMRRIEELKRDLDAKIITQEESGHSETGWDLDPESAGQSYDRPIIEVTGWVIDQPEVSIPDEQKRHEAKLRLEEISQTSPWYAAKYAAAHTLGWQNTERLIESWLPEIAKKLEDSERGEMVSKDMANLLKVATSKGSAELESFLLKIIESNTNLTAMNWATHALRLNNSTKLESLLEKIIASTTNQSAVEWAADTLDLNNYGIWALRHSSWDNLLWSIIGLVCFIVSVLITREFVLPLLAGTWFRDGLVMNIFTWFLISLALSIGIFLMLSKIAHALLLQLLK